MNEQPKPQADKAFEEKVRKVENAEPKQKLESER